MEKEIRYLEKQVKHLKIVLVLSSILTALAIALSFGYYNVKASGTLQSTGKLVYTDSQTGENIIIDTADHEILQEDINKVSEDLGDLVKSYHYNSGETTKTYTKDKFTYTGVSFYIPAKHTAVFTQSTNNRSAGNPTIELGYAINTHTAGEGQVAGRTKHNSVAQFQSINSTNVVSNDSDVPIMIYFYVKPSADVLLAFDIATALIVKTE